ncbi:hypothetical protein N7520_000501 [Penicillium odoratum]|uniref:uncharacterized protein n=1 Tax=Penicillium odoratum TaxID=1167516 RepID=UPI002547C2C6|nr:uncharacterized protein N7520_000501 [Penicillium odoratum]KAJ5777255.1 hypothetical protein N7520_000501 [Penicillium odoratum]
MPPAGISDPDRNSTTLNMHDMNLLQHYILHTSKKLSLDAKKVLVWERVIPDIAAKNTFLMHLVVALAGLDILTTDQQDEQTYTVDLRTLVEHHQKGLQGFQEKLASVEDKNAEVLFTGSILIVAFAFASLRVGNLDLLTLGPQSMSAGDSSPRTSHRYERPHVQWLRLIRGATFIVRDLWAALSLSRVRPLLLFKNANEDWQFLGESPLPSLPSWLVRSQRLSAFILGENLAVRKLQEFLDTLKTRERDVGDDLTQSSSGPSPASSWNHQPDEIFAAQDEAIAVTAQMFKRITYAVRIQPVESSSSDREMHAEMEDAAITSWPGLVPEAFVSSLDSDSGLDIPNCFSCVILAHLYLVLALPDEIWYLGKNFAAEIRKIHALVAQFGNPQLCDLMIWPMDVLGFGTESR